MQVSVHLGDVKNVLRAYSIDVQASSANDLKEVSAACFLIIYPVYTFNYEGL